MGLGGKLDIPHSRPSICCMTDTTIEIGSDTIIDLPNEVLFTILEMVAENDGIALGSHMS